MTSELSRPGTALAGFFVSNLPLAAVSLWALIPSSLTHCANIAHDKPLFFKCDPLPAIFKSLRESGGGTVLCRRNSSPEGSTSNRQDF